MFVFPCFSGWHGHQGITSHHSGFTSTLNPIITQHNEWLVIWFGGAEAIQPWSNRAPELSVYLWILECDLFEISN